MKDASKTKKQLISELEELRRQLAHVQSSEAEFQQLKESNEKFVKAFLQNSIPMDITLLRNGRYVDVSEAFLRFLGLKRSEVIGSTATELELITAEQKAIFIKELNSKGRVENLELQVKTKGGDLRDGLFNAVMMTLNNEKYLLTVMADITSRRQAEEALRKSAEKFPVFGKIVLESYGCGIGRSVSIGYF
jgi:PAS domain S-box-containing protein